MHRERTRRRVWLDRIVSACIFGAVMGAAYALFGSGPAARVAWLIGWIGAVGYFLGASRDESE